MKASDILLFLLVATVAIITISTIGVPLTSFRSEEIVPLMTENCPNALSSLGGASDLEGSITVVGQLWKCSLGLVMYLLLPGAIGIAFLFLKWFFR